MMMSFICQAAEISINGKYGMMDGVILGNTNSTVELKSEEQSAHFDSGWDSHVAAGSQAIKLKPDDPRSYARRAHAEMSKGDYEGAIADYTTAIELAPNTSLASYYNNRGNAKSRKRDWDGAISDMTKAVELDPKHYPPSDPYLASIYTQRGYLKLSKREFDEAIADLTKAIEITADDVSALIKRGSAKRFKRDLDGAIADYTKIIELKPEVSTRATAFYSAAAYYNRGLLMMTAKGDPDAAEADFKDALKLNPALAEAQIRLDELNRK